MGLMNKFLYKAGRQFYHAFSNLHCTASVLLFRIWCCQYNMEISEAEFCHFYSLHLHFDVSDPEASCWTASVLLFRIWCCQYNMEISEAEFCHFYSLHLHFDVSDPEASCWCFHQHLLVELQFPLSDLLGFQIHLLYFQTQLRVLAYLQDNHSICKNYIGCNH